MHAANEAARLDLYRSALAAGSQRAFVGIFLDISKTFHKVMLESQ